MKFLKTYCLGCEAMFLFSNSLPNSKPIRNTIKKLFKIYYFKNPLPEIDC